MCREEELMICERPACGRESGVRYDAVMKWIIMQIQRVANTVLALAASARSTVLLTVKLKCGIIRDIKSVDENE
jgi:hypothetical protein